MTEDQLREIVAAWGRDVFVPYVYAHMTSAGAALYSASENANLPGEIFGRIRMAQESSVESSLVDLTEADVLKTLEELKGELFLPVLTGAIVFREIEPPCAAVEANVGSEHFRLLVRAFYWHISEENAGQLAENSTFAPISVSVPR